MSLTQWSAGIMAVVFSLTTIGSELVLATDRTDEQRRADAKFDSAIKEKPRKVEKQGPFDPLPLPMFPGGVKF